MSTELMQQTGYTVTLSGEERESLLRLLRQTLGDARVEMHRTHSPAFRELIFGEQAVIKALVEKLERTSTDQLAVSPRMPAGIEEGWPVPDVIYIDEAGRFQMATEELEEFIRFLHDNEVRVEAETTGIFHSGGKAHGYGRLLHLFDADAVSRLYRTWRHARASTAAGEIT